MEEQMKAKIENWYKRSPKRSFAISILYQKFKQETNSDVSYSYFFQNYKKSEKSAKY